MSYLKFWDSTYRPSVPSSVPSSVLSCSSVPSSVPSSSSVLCPFIAARPVVVVRPHSIHPVARPIITYITSRSIRRKGKGGDHHPSRVSNNLFRDILEYHLAEVALQVVGMQSGGNPTAQIRTTAGYKPLFYTPTFSPCITLFTS